MPLDFSRYFEDYTGNNRAKPTQYKGRGANTAARKRLDMEAMQTVANGIIDGAVEANAPDSWWDIYGRRAVDGRQKFKQLVADVYYKRPLDTNAHWPIRRGNRGWTPYEYSEWLHYYYNLAINTNNNGVTHMRIDGNGPADTFTNSNNRPPSIENNNNNNSIVRNLSIKANRPSGWYNTSGNLKTINRNVITSPISMAPVNLKNLDKLYLDQNSGSRYLYTKNEVMKMKENPVTRGKMAPRLLPNNIKSAIRKYVEANAATRIQTAVRGRQAIGLARAKAANKLARQKP